MARGANAKVAVTEKIAAAFGKDFIGEYDKKIYVWADDGGERVQIAIAMTCPKTFIGEVDNNVMDFENMSEPGQISSFKPAEVTEEEKKNVSKLLAELGF